MTHFIIWKSIFAIPIMMQIYKQFWWIKNKRGGAGGVTRAAKLSPYQHGDLSSNPRTRVGTPDMMGSCDLSAVGRGHRVCRLARSASVPRSRLLRDSVSKKGSSFFFFHEKCYFGSWFEREQAFLVEKAQRREHKTAVHTAARVGNQWASTLVPGRFLLSSLSLGQTN